jgi:hypothetical protein
MKENAIRDKSFAFALRIVKLYQYLTEQKKEYDLTFVSEKSRVLLKANVGMKARRGGRDVGANPLGLVL